MISDEDTAETPEVSRSARKRAARAFQEIAAQLVTLRADQLARLPLDERLRAALDLAHRLARQRGALKRQINYIGGLLRDAAVENDIPWVTYLHAVTAGDQAHTAQDQAIERWRARLLKEGDLAVDALLAEFPRLDRPRLRRLVTQAQMEKQNSSEQRAQRELFRYLRAEMHTADDTL